MRYCNENKLNYIAVVSKLETKIAENTREHDVKVS